MTTRSPSAIQRSHRSGDEEFYLPFLPLMRDTQDLLIGAAGWLYFYNPVSPRYGEGMGGKAPLPEGFALFTIRWIGGIGAAGVRVARWGNYAPRDTSPRSMV
ncbi:MAG: hypothetical protein ACK4K2_03130 [Dehalococcoidia bacterium]